MQTIINVNGHKSAETSGNEKMCVVFNALRMVVSRDWVTRGVMCDVASLVATAWGQAVADHVLFVVSSVSIQFILGSITENYHGLDTQYRHTSGSQLIIANHSDQSSMKL